MNFRATFVNDEGEGREEYFEYDYDATALVEPFAESLAHKDETLVEVKRIPGLFGGSLGRTIQGGI